MGHGGRGFGIAEGRLETLSLKKLREVAVLGKIEKRQLKRCQMVLSLFEAALVTYLTAQPHLLLVTSISSK